MRIIGLMVGIVFLSWIMAPVNINASEKSFTFDASYDGSFVKINLERVSRDEVKDFMQRIIVYKDEGVRTEESLINQNHLNEIEKWISYKADEGDTITVELHYGKDQVLTKVITINSDEGDQDEAVLETNIEGGEIRRRAEASISSGLTLSEWENKQLGYDDTNKDVGERGYGYTPEKNKYGYQKDDSFKSNIKYGYDDTNKDIGEKGYGYELQRKKEKTESYGRKDMDIEFKR